MRSTQAETQPPVLSVALAARPQSMRVASGQDPAPTAHELNDTNEARLRSLCSSISSSASDSSASTNPNVTASDSASRSEERAAASDEAIASILDELVARVGLQIEEQPGDYVQKARHEFKMLSSVSKGAAFDEQVGVLRDLSHVLVRLEEALLENKSDSADGDSASLDMSNLDDVLVKYFDFLNDEEASGSSGWREKDLESDFYLLLCIHLRSCADLLRGSVLNGDRLSREVAILRTLTDRLTRKEFIFELETILNAECGDLKRSIWSPSQRVVAKCDLVRENARNAGVEIDLERFVVYEDSHVSLFHFDKCFS